MEVCRWFPCGGKWERRAMRARVVIREVDGLTHPRLPPVKDGCPPIFVLPRWARGPIRELAVCWLWGELMDRHYGEDQLTARLSACVGAPPALGETA